ncbi:uncharacterized protein LOC113665312, partial [Pocillopora damicornis]|uniref:uncharacterized protein LOC113665312 n=1 Tax=Pocillopora damicornis TaxID=46731 RepID=UPI000F54D225
MSSTADVILYGGSIITMDEKNPSAEALAVTGNIITAVGKLDEVFALAGETTKVIYLNQKTLLPGFIEPHTHATALVLVNTAYTNISGYDYHTYNDVNEKMKETIRKLDTETSPLPWALFFGWDPELIPSLPLLSADFLDKVFSSEVPVVVVGQSGHVAWVNRKAFEVANVDDSIENADGGVFVKDDEGHLTGQLFEVYAIERVTSYAPQPTLSDLQTKIKDQWKDFASRGFTTVTEMAYQRNPAFDTLLLKESEQRDCPIRLALYQVVYDQDEPIIEGSDKLWVAGVKVIADGSPHCGTAAVQEPYLNSNLTEILGFPESPQYGTLNYTTDELLEIVQSYHKKGTQIAIHAHGERAIDQVLTVYEQVVSKVPKDTRHRIEHLGLATVDTIARAGELKLALSFFVCHLYFYAKSFTEYIFGRERTDRWTPLSE